MNNIIGVREQVSDALSCDYSSNGFNFCAQGNWDFPVGAVKFKPVGLPILDGGNPSGYSDEMLSYWTAIETALNPALDMVPSASNIADLHALLTGGATHKSFMVSDPFTLVSDAYLQFDYTDTAVSNDATYGELSYIFVIDEFGNYSMLEYNTSADTVSLGGAKSSTGGLLNLTSGDGAGRFLGDGREYVMVIASLTGSESYSAGVNYYTSAISSVDAV